MINMGKNTYIIGEIGQNHNGSTEIAKLIIDLASRTVDENLFNLKLKPMDAVKLTKRDLNFELSNSQMERPYSSIHSFGNTYGAHREYLELNDEEHFEVFQHAKSKDLDFVETLCAPSCLSILNFFKPDYLKVASRDLTNLILLHALAETRIPIILSTGMAGKRELDAALNLISKHHTNISILHCVSQYPTEPQNANLNTIKYLLNNYSDYIIGFSDHSIGIAMPLAAVALGAKIIEKHITIDRRMKGTDQAGSLGPDGVNRMVRDIRLFEMSLGEEDIFIDDSVKDARLKLERSIASKRKILKGEKIAISDIHLLSPGDGIKWIDNDKIIGTTALVDIETNEIIYPNLVAKI